MSAILVNDRIVHYEVLGRGRPIILLHGWVGSWRYWIPTMQAAAMSFRAYALDLWGFGETAHDLEHYSLDHQASLLDEFLMRMGIAKVALVGHGLGALVSIQFARRFPTMVDRMMLVDVPLEIRAVNPRLRTPASSADLGDWLLAQYPPGEPARADAAKADPLAIVRSMDSLMLSDLLLAMDMMSTPCLIVHGENDPAIETPDYGRIQAMPERVHQVVLEECGHFPMLDQPGRFHRLMADFLALESGESPRQLQLKEEWKRRVR